MGGCAKLNFPEVPPSAVLAGGPGLPRGGPHLSPAGLSAASQRVALLQAPTVGEGAAHEEAQNMQVSRPAL